MSTAPHRGSRSFNARTGWNSSHTKERSRSAVHIILCVAPRWSKRQSCPYKIKEQISCAVHSLCCSSLSHAKVKSITPTRLSLQRELCLRDAPHFFPNFFFKQPFHPCFFNPPTGMFVKRLQTLAPLYIAVTSKPIMQF